MVESCKELEDLQSFHYNHKICQSFFNSTAASFPTTSKLFRPSDLPPTTAPEQCVGPPSPLCACSRSTPTEAAAGHWASCWAVTYHSGPRSLPLKARHRLYARIGIRGSDHQPCREPAGSSRT